MVTYGLLVQIGLHYHTHNTAADLVLHIDVGQLSLASVKNLCIVIVGTYKF